MTSRLIALLALLAIPAAAQNVVVGSQSLYGASAHVNLSAVTYIDLSHPATADGTVTTASVLWLVHSCTGAFKVKLLRPSNPLLLASFTLVAERGPFNAAAARNQVVLTPPVDVKQGDLIAVTSLVAESTCGSPGTWSSTGSATMQINGDVSSGAFNGVYLRNSALAARATDTADVLEGVLAAAGSLQGSAGSFFRTSLQIACPGGGTCSGRIVYHPAGSSASPADQAYPYTVSGGGALSYADIVQTMGKSGLGTIDVISNNGFPPLVTARIYNDAGANGTSGFMEEMIRTGDVLHAGDSALLLTPADLTAFRVNIGVRTLSGPASINIQHGFRLQSDQDFPANTFQQFPLSAFGGADPVANEQIYLYVNSGDVVIYESTIDNKTNDSSIKFAQRQ